MDRERILLLLAEGVSTEDLVLIHKFMPHLLTEMVRELDGKVKYVQVDLTEEDGQ